MKRRSFFAALGLAIAGAAVFWKPRISRDPFLNKYQRLEVLDSVVQGGSREHCNLINAAIKGQVKLIRCERLFNPFTEEFSLRYLYARPVT